MMGGNKASGGQRGRCPLWTHPPKGLRPFGIPYCFAFRCGHPQVVRALCSRSTDITGGPGGLTRPRKARKGQADRTALTRSLLLILMSACLLLSACGQPGVELVQNGTVPQNPTASVGLALKSYPGFKDITWEQYTDAQGVTCVLATGEFRMDLPEIRSCPKRSQNGLVLASRAFLRMKFVTDVKAKTFAFEDAQYLVYSPKGFSNAYPGGLSAFEAILQGTSGLNCGLLYAPGP